MCNANIFRTLLPDEIDVRVQQVIDSTKKKAVLLLYKNARIDMDLLDEQFGCLGWQREHNFKDGKNYCKVSVYDSTKQMWISKEDVGIESKTEETKGEASDSFKRACVNLGIGRELYSAPSILVDINDDEWSMNKKSGKPAINSWIKFRVHTIEYNEQRKITNLIIIDGKNNIRYQMGATKTTTSPQKQKLTVDALMDEAYSQNVAKFIYEQWSKRKNSATTIEDVIKYYYICDEATVNNLATQIHRTYA